MIERNIVGGFICLLHVGATKGSSIEPVSYTHLDVYKRQPVIFIFQFIALNHGTHGTIQYQNTVFQNFANFVFLDCRSHIVVYEA